MLTARRGCPSCGWSGGCSSARASTPSSSTARRSCSWPAAGTAWWGGSAPSSTARFNDYQQNAWGMFGFLELENDPEAMAALLEAAYGWLREHGRDRAVGPMDFTLHDECGVLIEGYDRAPMVRQPWHPPYYRELCEGAGLEKAVDLFMWELHISGKENVLPVIWELAEKLEPEHGITAAPDAPADAAPRPRRVRRDLQRGLVAQLGLRALLEGGPRRLRPGAPHRLRSRLVHDRRDRRGRGRGRGDHDPGHQPGAEADERAACCRSAGCITCGGGGSSTAAAWASSA